MTTGMKVLPMTEGATEETSQDILVAVTALQSDLNTLAGIDYATEATATGIASTLTTLAKEATATGIAAELVTLNATATGIAANVTKLKKWPYATHDTIVSSYASGTFTDTVLYKTGGASGTTVGTITTVYADAAKNPPSTTTFSPVKAV